MDVITNPFRVLGLPLLLMFHTMAANKGHSHAVMILLSCLLHMYNEGIQSLLQKP